MHRLLILFFLKVILIDLRRLLSEVYNYFLTLSLNNNNQKHIRDGYVYTKLRYLLNINYIYLYFYSFNITN